MLLCSKNLAPDSADQYRMSIEQAQLKELRIEIVRSIVREMKRPWMCLADTVHVNVEPRDLHAAEQTLYLDCLAGRISEPEFEEQLQSLTDALTPGFACHIIVHHPVVFWAWYRTLVRLIAKGLRCHADNVERYLNVRLVPTAGPYHQAYLDLTFRNSCEMESLFQAMQFSLRRFPI